LDIEARAAYLAAVLLVIITWKKYFISSGEMDLRI
jgi:hypothetical protein